MKKSKGILQQRRDARAICQICKSPDYKIKCDPDVTKPLIICKQCGNCWMYGNDGGKYVELHEKG